jgi:hypothetical protein
MPEALSPSVRNFQREPWMKSMCGGLLFGAFLMKASRRVLVQELVRLVPHERGRLPIVGGVDRVVAHLHEAVHEDAAVVVEVPRLGAELVDVQPR